MINDWTANRLRKSTIGIQKRGSNSLFSPASKPCSIHRGFEWSRQSLHCYRVLQRRITFSASSSKPWYLTILEAKDRNGFRYSKRNALSTHLVWYSHSSLRSQKSQSFTISACHQLYWQHSGKDHWLWSCKTSMHKGRNDDSQNRNLSLDGSWSSQQQTIHS